MIRLDFLTLIRYPLAIWVLLYHLIDPSYLIWPKLTFIDKAIIDTGKLAPSIFFIISGFVITQSLVNKPSIKNFYYRRFSYVLPIFIITSTLIATKFELDRGKYFLNIFGITPFLTSPSWFVLNGPAWSLIIEIWFYILIPFTYAKLLKIKKYTLCIFLILFIQLALPILLKVIWDDKIVISVIYHNPVYHITNFLLGIFLYSKFRNQRKLATSQVFLWKIVSFILFFSGLIFTYSIETEVYKFGTLIIPGAVALIYVYSAEQKFKVNSKVYNRMSYLGESAFAIYITQWLWIGIVREKINGISSYPEFILNLLIIVLIVTIIALVFDKYVLRIISNFPLQDLKMRSFSILVVGLTLSALAFSNVKSNPYLTTQSVKSVENLFLTDIKLLKQADNSITIQTKAQNVSDQDIFIYSCTFLAQKSAPQTEKDKFTTFNLNIRGAIKSSSASWIESKVDKNNPIWPAISEIFNSGTGDYGLVCN